LLKFKSLTDKSDTVHINI